MAKDGAKGAFAPQAMQVGVLTAALQELTPREKRDPDPDLAVEEWLAFAQEVGADSIQLSAALHPDEADVPPEAMLDPVANTLDLRAPLDRARADRILSAVKQTGVEIADVAFFDNMLHADPAIRQKKLDFMLRVFDAAVLLGAPAVCGFVGKNQGRTIEENLVDFEAVFVPLMQEAIEIDKKTYGEEHQYVINDVGNLGCILLLKEDAASRAEGAELVRSSLAKLRDMVAPPHQDPPF